jgi:hypothetical protein
VINKLNDQDHDEVICSLIHFLSATKQSRRYYKKEEREKRLENNENRWS